MSCLFQSVCRLIEDRRGLLAHSRYAPLASLARHERIAHEDLRLAVTGILDAIKVHGTPLSEWGEMETGVSGYASHMRGTDVWGGGVELAALSKGLRVPIVVKQPDGAEYTFGRAHSNGEPPLRLLYSGTHYTPDRQED
jgi:hypothetical protein